MNFATLSRPIVSAIMSLLANDGDTKLLQEPQVTTENNSPANILIGTTIPVLVPQGEGSVFGTNPYTYENQEVNVSLDVLPRTNKDRVIHFGHKDYEQYKDRTKIGLYTHKNHGDIKRQRNYYNRHSGEKNRKKAINKEIKKSKGYYNPKVLSHIYLW